MPHQPQDLVDDWIPFVTIVQGHHFIYKNGRDISLYHIMTMLVIALLM
jgi:hypothetical protein